MVAVFLNIENAFDKTWHPDLLYELSKLQLSFNLIKFISPYLSQRQFRVSVEGEISTHSEIEAGVPQGFVLAPTIYNLYINDISQTPGFQLAFFADDTYIYATERKEGYVLRKLQLCLTAMEA
jgi:retron-type reverse transcriptase